VTGTRRGPGTERAEEGPPSAPAMLDRLLPAVARRVAGDGWTWFFGPFGGGPVAIAYTVGVAASFGAPEAAVLGLGAGTAGAALAAYAALARVGRVPAPGSPLDLGLTHPLVPRPVTAAAARRHLVIADAFYRGRCGYDAVQLVWPDPRGRFPWEGGHAPGNIVQPLLFDTTPLD
jgi:hypothetical protein